MLTSVKGMNKIINKEQLEFVVFCIENFADKYNLDVKKVYDAFIGNDNIINNYIVKNYDVLHRQGKEYIVRELKDLIDRKGIVI